MSAFGINAQEGVPDGCSLVGLGERNAIATPILEFGSYIFHGSVEWPPRCHATPPPFSDPTPSGGGGDRGQVPDPS